MITEDYVSFETSKLLKAKGFNERCFSFYWPDGSLDANSHDKTTDLRNSNSSNSVAPTLQMAMKWLREVHNIHIVPMIENNGNYIGYLYDTKGNNVQGWDRRLSKTSYEEACEAALEYCLENLI